MPPATKQAKLPHWLRRWRRYEADNVATARIIAADPQRYAGLSLLWAQAVLRKQVERKIA